MDGSKDQSSSRSQPVFAASPSTREVGLADLPPPYLDTLIAMSLGLSVQGVSEEVMATLASRGWVATRTSITDEGELAIRNCNEELYLSAQEYLDAHPLVTP